MSARKARPAISRRRFVGLLAAGSAAVIARDAAAATAPRKRRAAAHPVPPVPAATPSAVQKEFERQKANTLGALQAIRAYKLPPGGDLSVVFRPLPSRRGR